MKPLVYFILAKHKPVSLSFVITHSKLPLLGGAGLRSTLTSPKVWRKSSASAKALRLNTCQDLLKHVDVIFHYFFYSILCPNYIKLNIHLTILKLFWHEHEIYVLTSINYTVFYLFHTKKKPNKSDRQVFLPVC